MGKKEKIIIALIATSLLCSVGYTYYKTMIQHQFETIDYVQKSL